MVTITKLYHRSRRGNKQPNYLTSVFNISLDVNTTKCKQILGPFFVGRIPEADLFDLVVPEFSDGSDEDMLAELPVVEAEFVGLEPPDRSIDTSQPEKVPLPIKGVRLNDGKLEGCHGMVTLTLNVDLSSPTGKGNGDVMAGPQASQFGLVYAGAFTRFNGGAINLDSEHWRVIQSIQLNQIPCSGGESKGTVAIATDRNGAGAEYIIRFDVVITSCGKIEKADFNLMPLAGVAAPIKEVKEGDDIGFPLKNPRPTGAPKVVVAPSGQPAVLI